MSKKLRIFNGFGVVTRQGHFLGQYFKPKLSDTETLYLQHNPQIEGHDNGHKFVKVKISIEDLEG